MTLEELTLQRVLFGLFVSYKSSPLPPAFDRILQVPIITLWTSLFPELLYPHLFTPHSPCFTQGETLPLPQVGDASGIQSPLSFGGFGAITRHLRRLTLSVCDALHAGCLTRESLGAINPYQPSLRAAWLFQVGGVVYGWVGMRGVRVRKR